MPEFDDRRNQLNELRAQKERLSLQLFQSKEQNKSLQAEQSRLAQIFDANNPIYLQQQQQLEQQQSTLRAEIKAQEIAYFNLKELEVAALTTFSPLLDPREQINQFSDRYPILLLPVRLETRFKTSNNPDGDPLQELWVRVYPDDCAIDSFEPFLSASEFKNLRTYWIELWKAGGIESQERGAWRGLVSSHGSGRAAWMLQQDYKPLNTKPAKSLETDITLVIPADTLPTEAERTALQSYWREIWLADGDLSQTTIARNNLTIALDNDATRSELLAEQYVPTNLKDRPRLPLEKSDVNVNVAFLHLPSEQAIFTNQQSWSQAPKTSILPDAFVLIAYDGEDTLEFLGQPIPSPLIVGPDPSAPASEQIYREADGNLTISEDMRWMVDFEKAIDVGMGFKIPLTPEQAERGFDRLLVLGVKLSADHEESQKALETLIQHHHQSGSGFALVSQGTPTNNTDQSGSGFSRSEEADESFDDYFRNATSTLGNARDSLFALSTNPSTKRDGQWLAELLGINPAILKNVHGSNGTDQREARAINTALWPATLGYWMESMMYPVFSGTAVEDTRSFFTQFVSGRGAIPAIRIGKQPYGILATTAFSRIRWVSSPNRPDFLRNSYPFQSSEFFSYLLEILQNLNLEWENLSRDTSFIGKQGDAHKNLLDIVGLHSGSVEFYQRHGQSIEHSFNWFNLGGLGAFFLDGLKSVDYLKDAAELLRQLGYNNLPDPDEELDLDNEFIPDILKKIFFGQHYPLKTSNGQPRPVVDDRPLSETNTIRLYASSSSDESRIDQNYLQWLRVAAQTSLDVLRRQSGFANNQPPTALLYLLLRHALILGYWDTSLRLHEDAKIFSADEVAALRQEPNFVHVGDKSRPSKSPWQYLYNIEPRIVGSNKKITVADYISRSMSKLSAARYLQQQIEAVDALINVPTARLERVFTEHIDCCSYRLDAWHLGLVNYQLQAMRGLLGQQTQKNQPLQGLYLGAFSWLENVRPENKPLKPITLDGELEKTFKSDLTDSPILQDAGNGGYIHAPSLNQAVTAAVLRNGYLSNATSDHPETFAVNLSSQRVRLALSMLEGIRNGQSLGALLGYQLERGLHDQYDLAEVDEFIYKLRKEFPLRANHLKNTEVSDIEDIQFLEARNVLDGLSLINHIKATGNQTYPFGKSLERGTPSQEAAINAEVVRLLNIHDAIADLAMAESVHQSLQGNYDRAAATLDTYSKGNFPPEPDVVQTPRSGIALTHRVGLHLQPGLVAADLGTTPRAQAEPALNHWLKSIMPPPERIGCKVCYFDFRTNEPILDPITNQPVMRSVTQQNLQLEPIDLIYLVRTDNEQAMTELDDRILFYLMNQEESPLRPDISLKILYTEKPSNETEIVTESTDDKISFFELAPMMHSLRSLLLRSRPLRASDITLANQANQAQDEGVFIGEEQIRAFEDGLAIWKGGEDEKSELTKFRDSLEALLANGIANKNEIITEIDRNIKTTIYWLATGSLYGFPQTGWGFALDWKQRIFRNFLNQVNELVRRWDDRLTQSNELVAAYDALPSLTTDSERYELLHRAERLVSTISTNSVNITPDQFRREDLPRKQAIFFAKLNQFRAIERTTNTTIATLRNDIATLLPISEFDLTPFTLTDLEDETIRFTSDLLSSINALEAEVDRRLSKTEEFLATYRTSNQPIEKVTALQNAAKVIFGDEFQLVPEFSLTTEQSEAWQNSLNDSQNGTLTNYLTTTVGIDFPVDHWLYGAARVREKLRHWEQLVMLTGAFGGIEPDLNPIQLPYKTNDHWLALQFPYDSDPNTKADPDKNYQFDGDRLLYTAHYATPFDKTQSQCGLLIDEWTEVIPSDTETTGITFNYDRPNSEPPQTMLLVTPSNFTGSWQWEDLVAALNQTLDLAKKRAVEPDQIENTSYTRFIPATVMATSLRETVFSVIFNQ